MSRATVLTALKQWARQTGNDPEDAEALVRALEAEALEKASEIAYTEGDRLYDDMGQKAAQGAWSVSTLLKALAVKAVECPPGVHSIFDPCPGNCSLPVVEED